MYVCMYLLFQASGPCDRQTDIYSKRKHRLTTKQNIQQRNYLITTVISREFKSVLC